MSLLSISSPQPARPTPDTNREALAQLASTTLAQRYRASRAPAPEVDPQARPGSAPLTHGPRAP